MIIPAIDLIDGQVVRLYQGDYDKQTTFDLSPLAQLQS
ncbi:1-(5-phosphoribosyl)-5-((5-phosphoribosylamino)methylideneamino)imidazole-4-carboxamide isomerase, partial [Shewanella sp. 11B5]